MSGTERESTQNLPANVTDDTTEKRVTKTLAGNMRHPSPRLDPDQMTLGHLKLEVADRMRFPGYLALTDAEKINRNLPCSRVAMMEFIRRDRWLERLRSV